MIRKKLTIIIPHYESVQLLNELLLTIPQKDEIEVIVIDDKSITQSEMFQELVRKSRFDDVNFLYNKTEKKGAGVCRNIGLQNAHGDWILFADADDFFLPQWYQKLRKYYDKELDVVFFRPTSIYLETRLSALRHTYFANILQQYLVDSNRKQEMVLRYCIPVPWSKLINRKFIDKYNIRFDEVIAANDVMFSTKIGYYMRKFQVTEEEIYCVTKSKNSLTGKSNKDVFLSRLLTNIRYYNFLKEHLNDKEFQTLKPKSVRYLIDSLKYGLSTFLKTVKIYRQNKIKWFYLDYLNPYVLLISIYRRWQKNKGIR